MIETPERTQAAVDWVEVIRCRQPPPPRAGLMDWLMTLAIGLQITNIAVGFIVATCVYDALAWWAFRAITTLPLIVLSGLLVARSLKRHEWRH